MIALSFVFTKNHFVITVDSRKLYQIDVLLNLIGVHSAVLNIFPILNFRSMALVFHLEEKQKVIFGITGYEILMLQIICIFHALGEINRDDNNSEALHG